MLHRGHLVWDEDGDPSVDAGEPVGVLIQNQSPYRLTGDDFRVALSYPGTHLQDEITEDAKQLLVEQVNLIGIHTPMLRKASGKPAEGGFEIAQEREAAVIAMIASILGGNHETVDGFFCGGATEANLQGMWIGREWLRQHPDPMGRGIAVLTTWLRHYSIDKGADILDIGKSRIDVCPLCQKRHIFVTDTRGCGLTLVPMDQNGAMDVKGLEKVFWHKYEEGFRRFLVVATVGTTVLGSVDPVQSISRQLLEWNNTTAASCYLHIDAAFGGFTVPFIQSKGREPVGFKAPGEEGKHANDAVMSIALDADKMGRMPYPSGVFLCRRGLQHLIERNVEYVGGHKDDTVTGSRSALAPLLAYSLYRKTGRKGQREYVKDCIALRDDLEYALRGLARDLRAENAAEEIVILPCPPDINILPVVFNFCDGSIPQSYLEGRGSFSFLAKYHLRSEFVPEELNNPMSCPHRVFKLVIMHHAVETQRKMLDEGKSLCQLFIDDLRKTIMDCRKMKEMDDAFETRLNALGRSPESSEGVSDAIEKGGECVKAYRQRGDEDSTKYCEAHVDYLVSLNEKKNKLARPSV